MVISQRIVQPVRVASSGPKVRHKPAPADERSEEAGVISQNSAQPRRGDTGPSPGRASAVGPSFCRPCGAFFICGLWTQGSSLRSSPGAGFYRAFGLGWGAAFAPVML